jgi:hypothetical protein
MSPASSWERHRLNILLAYYESPKLDNHTHRQRRNPRSDHCNVGLRPQLVLTPCLPIPGTVLISHRSSSCRELVYFTGRGLRNFNSLA